MKIYTKKRRVVKDKKKLEFLKRNKKIVYPFFRSHVLFINSPLARLITNMARKQLRYSCYTVRVDILYSLKSVYNAYIKKDPRDYWCIDRGVE